jgi:RNA polymerase sigma-70 factor (ECF subfamily)
MRPDPDPATGTLDSTAARDEHRLVEGLLAHETAAVSEFLERSHHPVYCMACRLSRDADTRRDWSHDVLLGILDDLARGRFEYRGPGSFWAWFRKRAYYRLLDCYRGAKRTLGRESPQGGTLDLPESALRLEQDPAQEMQLTLTRSALEACLQRLENRDHRRALDLLLFEDLAYDAIAERLDTPINTVRAWIRRGRLQVRRCLVESLDLLTGGTEGR